MHRVRATHFDLPYYKVERLKCNRERPTLTVLLNYTDLIGWDPSFAFADWLGSKAW